MSRTDTHSTDTRSALYPKGAGHMTTTSAKCPGTVCTCGGSELVTVRVGTDRRTGRATLTYSPCAALVAQGWRGRVAVVAWA